MAKNRRKSHAQSSTDKHDSKRQKIEASNDLYDKLKQVVLEIYKLKDDQNYEIITDFLQLPSKSDYPDYYDEIANPISIAEINNKIAKKQYSSWLEFIQDFKLMSDNAIQYNEEESFIAQNALRILEAVKSHVETFEKPLPKIKLRLGGIHTSEARPKPTTEKSNVSQKFSDLIDELIEYEDNGVKIGEPFLHEVSRKDYPDYYKLIKHAMSFSTVKKNINQNKYKTVDDFVKHVDLIWHNAQLYNEEGSLIYEDSKTLQTHFNTKIEDLKKELDTSREPEEQQTEEEAKEELKEEPEEEEPQDDQSTLEDSILETPQSVLKTPEVQESGVETPVKKKLGRPKGRPPKSKLNIVQDLEEESQPEPSIAEYVPQPQIPITYSILDVPSNISNNDLLTPMNYVSKILATTTPKTQLNLVSNSLIEEITISSSRSIYRQSVKSSNNAQLSAIFQDWFEYKFLASEKPIKNFAITLPPQQSAVSVAAGLSDSLIKVKHAVALTVNGERVNPTPSIHYADNGRTLTSRYELKLPTGLNKVSFDLQVENGQGLVKDEDPTRSSRSNDGSIQDTLIFWIEVL